MHTRIRINSCLDDIEKGLRLTPIQFRNFKNDLTIILEAGWICYDVTPENDYKGAVLLTNNIKLLKKFISNVGNRESLEEKINLLRKPIKKESFLFYGSFSSRETERFLRNM